MTSTDHEENKKSTKKLEAVGTEQKEAPKGSVKKLEPVVTEQQHTPAEVKKEQSVKKLEAVADGAKHAESKHVHYFVISGIASAKPPTSTRRPHRLTQGRA